MTSLSDHHASSIVKLLFIGDSSVGKTGAHISLVEAGYKLRFLDLDNGLDILVALVRKQCPDLIDMVDYETRRDKYKATTMGPVISGLPSAFTDSMKLMTKWSDDTDPAEWGEDTIFVLDTFDSLGRAAYEWAKGMNAIAVKPNMDPRSWIYTAQGALEDVLSLLCGEEFRTNVIVVSHVKSVELKDGTTKDFPAAIGSALSKHMGKYFNTILLAERSGEGKNIKRTIKTTATASADLKNPKPFTIDATLPLETGLATVFEKLKET